IEDQVAHGDFVFHDEDALTRHGRAQSPLERSESGRTRGYAAPRATSPGNRYTRPSRTAAPSRKGAPMSRRVVLAAACLLAGSCGGGGEPRKDDASGGGRLTVAMMPKNKGNPYFVSCHKGAEEAAAELGVKVLWDGPTETDPAKQNEVVEAWITRGVDVIAVSVENKEAISTVLRKAKGQGIKVVTWDADAEKDARDVFVDQATPQGIASVLLEHTSRLLGGKGSFAIITASLTAANQNEWIKNIKEQLASKYPDLKLVD